MTDTAPDEQDLELSSVFEFVLRRRWIILSVASAVLLAAAVVTALTKPVYEATTMLIIEKERGAGVVFANGALVESNNLDYYQTQYKLLQSLSLLQKVYAALDLGSFDDFREPHGIDKLSRNLSITPVIGSRLVNVSARAHDPALAARIANTLSESFVAENLSNQLFISKEVLQTLELNQNDAKTRHLYESLPNVVNNQLIGTLKADHAKLQTQAADMSQKLTDRHPAMVAIRSQMAALRNQIDAETSKVVQSLKTELSGQLKGNNVRVVDSAQVPDRPIKPRKLMNLLLGLLGGLVAGVLIGYLVELLDQSIRTQEDVENKLNCPFLGTIPLLSKRGAASVYEPLVAKEQSLTSESFRNLRTMVDFAGLAAGASQLLVTSSVQGEGKTYLASNLAVAFAQKGESVLLVDGDLRRPSLHKVFGLSRECGLSDFLASGTSVDEVEDSIQKTDVEGLRVLACGTRPPNPSELLNTPRLGALLASAKGRFDRVIVDCPPMFPINDTLLWGRHVRSVVFLARFGATRAPIMKSACQKLAAGGLKVLGVAVNAAKLGGLTYAGYDQKYYHQYYADQGRQAEPVETA